MTGSWRQIEHGAIVAVSPFISLFTAVKPDSLMSLSCSPRSNLRHNDFTA